jgi:hypothetical protein
MDGAVMRLLLALLALISSVAADAQTLRGAPRVLTRGISAALGAPPSGTGCYTATGGSVDADAQSYFNAVATAGGTLTSTDKTNIEILVIGLKTDCVWDHLDGLIIEANADEASAKVDVRKPSRTWTKSGTLTFVAYQGYTGDGLTGYLSGDDISTATPQLYSLNSASVAVVVTQAAGGATTSQSQSGQSQLTGATLSLRTGPSGNQRINSTATQQTSASGVRVGFTLMVREDSTTMRYYNNPSTTTALTNATSYSSTGISTGAISDFKAATTFSPDRHALFAYGEKLTGTQAKAFYDRWITFATAQSIPLS